MDKRRFIHKLNKILSPFKLFVDTIVSYTDDFIIIKFIRTNAIIKPEKYRRVWMIQTFFTEDMLIDLPEEYIKRKLQWRLRKLYEYT